MRIIDLNPEDDDAVSTVASLLVRVNGSDDGWLDDPREALRVVQESFAARSFSRVAFSESGAMLGWYSAREQRIGKLWERRFATIDRTAEATAPGDVWRAFADDLEEQARARGGNTVESLRRLNAPPAELITHEQAARHLNNLIRCLRGVSIS